MNLVEKLPSAARRYREILPTPQLAGLINCYWILEAEGSPATDLVFPELRIRFWPNWTRWTPSMSYSKQWPKRCATEPS